MADDEPSGNSTSVRDLRSRFEALQQPTRSASSSHVPTVAAADSSTSSSTTTFPRRVVSDSVSSQSLPSPATTATASSASTTGIDGSSNKPKKAPPPRPAPKPKPITESSPALTTAAPTDAEPLTLTQSPPPLLPPAKKRPPPPPPSSSTRPAISVSEASSTSIPKKPSLPPPLPGNRPLARTPPPEAQPMAISRSASAVDELPQSLPNTATSRSADQLDPFANRSGSPESWTYGARSVPGTRSASPSLSSPPRVIHHHNNANNSNSSALSSGLPSPAMLSAASAGDLSTYRPPPPIPARARSIPSSPAIHLSTRSSRSHSDAAPPLPPSQAAAPVSSPPRSSRPGPTPEPSHFASSSSSVSRASTLSSIRPPPSRTVALGERVAPVRPAVQPVSSAHGSDSDDEDADPSTATARLADSVPDASLASRRPPTFTSSGEYVRFATTSRFTCAIVRGAWLVVGSAHHVRAYDLNTKATVVNVPVSAEASKVTALNFRTSAQEDEDGAVIWAGTKDGNLVEVDLSTGQVTANRNNIHPGAVTRVDRLANGMVTLGETGKMLYWENDPTEGYPIMGFQSTESRRLYEDANFVELIHGKLWASSGPSSKADLRTPAVRIYEPSAVPTFDLTPRPLLIPDSTSVAVPSAASCACTVPAQPDLVYIGHESGHVTVWREDTRSYMLSLRVATASVTAMVGVDRYLWCGFKSGQIQIFDTSSNPWQLIVSFKAHNDQVAKLMVNTQMLWESSELPVVSLSSEGEVAVWDGLLCQWYLDKEMTLREADYSTYRKASCLVCSWNVDAQKPNALDENPVNHGFLRECLSTCDNPSIIAFSFQELIDLENKTLAAKSFIFGRKKGDKNMHEQVSHGYQMWRDRLAQEIRVAMPPDCPYSLVHAEVLVGLFTCIFVKDSEKANLRDLNISQVKTGLAGRFGNKGSIVARMVLDDTSICFSNCHLAAGQSHVRQRNKDLVDILDSGDALPAVADFAPNAYIGGGDGSMIFDHNIVILSGDLNYRIDLRRDAVIERVQSGRYNLLWEHDQLIKQMRTNPQHRLRSFKESELTFAPTYKYDRGTQEYDSSEKARCPAWCDRILWRSIGSNRGATAVESLDFRRYEANVSDHRPISAVLSLPVRREVADMRKGVLDESLQQWHAVKQEIVRQSKAYFEHYVA